MRIPLAGPLARPGAEISGLAWHEDRLVLLPQHPYRYASPGNHGRLFFIPRARLLAFLSDTSTAPLTPGSIRLVAPGIDQRPAVFQGFEALTFLGDRAFLITEATNDDTMRGYLVAGRLSQDGRTLRLETEQVTPIPAQTAIGNMAYEALFTTHDTLVAVYEANGVNVNPHPAVHLFDTDLRPLGRLPFPTVEYRITDATALDARRRFWVMNYFFPGERRKLDPAPDALTARYGTGTTHRRRATVERLVEFRLTPHGVERTDAPPLRLRLAEEDRNWEGLARLGPCGFLLVTDQYPETILAHVDTPSMPHRTGCPARR